MKFGGPTVQGPLGYTISHVFSNKNKQIQFSQMMIQTTKPQSIAITMVRGPGSRGLWDIHSSLYFKSKQTNSILPNDNPNLQAPEYST